MREADELDGRAPPRCVAGSPATARVSGVRKLRNSSPTLKKTKSWRRLPVSVSILFRQLYYMLLKERTKNKIYFHSLSLLAVRLLALFAAAAAAASSRCAGARGYEARRGGSFLLLVNKVGNEPLVPSSLVP